MIEKLREESGKWIEQFTFQGPSGDWVPVANNDWKLSMSKRIGQSQTKLNVCELATGNKFTEEWSVLPKNWQSPVDTTRTIFANNFVLFEFETIWTDSDSVDEPGDLLILNLASRKPFWMQKRLLENEIQSRVTALDPHGQPYDFENEYEFWMIDSVMRRMKVGKNKIKIKHYGEVDIRPRLEVIWAPGIQPCYDQIIVGTVEIFIKKF